MKKNFSINSINKFFYNLSKNDCIDQLIANESLNIVKGHPQYLNIFKLKTFLVLVSDIKINLYKLAC